MLFTKYPLPEVQSFLEKSQATEEFRTALLDFQSAGKQNPEILAANAGVPPVKYLRVIQKLLEVYPTWAIKSLVLNAHSGCSDFRGTLEVNLASGEQKTIKFVWDCAWRADQEGWVTAFGDPDQQRAAREFGYQCFESFDVQ